MGRTFRNYRDEEDKNYSKKSSGHSRNEPGKGMRILNEYEEDSYDDFDETLYDEHNGNTAQYYDTRRK
jgi:hypothetical protein